MTPYEQFVLTTAYPEGPLLVLSAWFFVLWIAMLADDITQERQRRRHERD